MCESIDNPVNGWIWRVYKIGAEARENSATSMAAQYSRQSEKSNQF
jgi:hypothetical protein